MNKKWIVNWLQNLVLVGLTVSALFLITRFSVFDGVLSGPISLLSMPESNVSAGGDISGAIATVHIAVTNELEYGRYTGMNIPVSGEEFKSLVPLLREAIGSAVEGEQVQDGVFRSALQTPGIYVDLTTSLPIRCVAAWLGEEQQGEGTVRSFAVTTEEETATLFLLDGEGQIVRCRTALTSAAVKELTVAFAPNGGRLAFESGYDTLQPYSVLVQESTPAADVSAALPGGYSAYNLLTALDFNAHTNSRYTESSGVEVVMQSPRTLRIGRDGSVSYSTSGKVDSELYQVTGSGAVPTAAEALKGACTIASALTAGTDASALTLEGAEQTENGWIITFGYHVNGVKVRLGDDRYALRVVVEGDSITAFDYYCRAYTPLEQSAVLLPTSMAVAIASLQTGAELSLVYVDSGSEVISASWLAE